LIAKEEEEEELEKHHRRVVFSVVYIPASRLVFKIISSDQLLKFVWEK
jgi:hypothetical protein